MSKETIKKSTKLTKVLPLDTASKPSLRNLLKFRATPRKVSQEKKPNSRGSVMNPVGFVQICDVQFFSYETFLRFVRNLKRFRSEGFDTVLTEEPFYVSSIFFYCLFRHFNQFESFLTSTEPFWVVQKKKNLLFQNVQSDVSYVTLA